jgi:hypothetical protein
METTGIRKVNVTAVFASFKTPKLYRRITPVAVEESGGTQHRVAQIRRTYIEKVGDSSRIHFVIRTEADRYFDLVFDTRNMVWFFVLELDETLFFNE